MVRRKANRQHRANYGPGHVFQLQHGDDYMGGGFGRGNPDLDEMRDAWEALQDRIMAEHIAELPGTRPWAWWMWSDECPAEHRKTYPGDGDQALILAEHDLLTPEEKQHLRQNGRMVTQEEYMEQARQSPHFVVTTLHLPWSEKCNS